MDYKHPIRWLDYPIDSLVRRWVTIFITGSVYAGERLKKTINLKNNHKAIPNGIRTRDLTLNNEQFREKYNLPKGSIIASVIANLEKRKGHIFLFEAIKQIRDNYKNASIPFFIIEGAGSEKADLVRFIADNRLEDNIWMVDHLDNIFNLINASDFLILPSISSEDFPNVILEAMSLGKPVIGTSIAGIPEQIENLKTGIIVEPRRAEDLENAIMKLATDSSLLAEFSLASKNRFNELFTEAISINKYIDLYKSLITN
jgi:glycosyltransferase involved in cell wall biosynthesis